MGGEGDQRDPLSPQWISHCQCISQRAVRTSLQKQLYPLIASPVGSVAVVLRKPFVIFRGGSRPLSPSSGSAHVLSHLIKYFDRPYCKWYEPRSDAVPLENNVFSFWIRVQLIHRSMVVDTMYSHLVKGYNKFRIQWWCIQCILILKKGTVSSQINGGGYNVFSS